MATQVLSVIGGSGSGNYSLGTQITVSANAGPSGQQFDGWTGDNWLLADPSLATTTATMSWRDATITAIYRP